MVAASRPGPVRRLLPRLRNYSSGYALWQVWIPFDPSLIGQRFFVQAAVLRAGSNPAGVVLSAGLANTLGM